MLEITGLGFYNYCDRKLLYEENRGIVDFGGYHEGLLG